MSEDRFRYRGSVTTSIDELNVHEALEVCCLTHAEESSLREAWRDEWRGIVPG